MRQLILRTLHQNNFVSEFQIRATPFRVETTVLVNESIQMSSLALVNLVTLVTSVKCVSASVAMEISPRDFFTVNWYEESTLEGYEKCPDR